jgi:hypothetical protein
MCYTNAMYLYIIEGSVRYADALSEAIPARVLHTLRTVPCSLFPDIIIEVLSTSFDYAN